MRERGEIEREEWDRERRGENGWEWVRNKDEVRERRERVREREKIENKSIEKRCKEKWEKHVKIGKRQKQDEKKHLLLIWKMTEIVTTNALKKKNDKFLQKKKQFSFFAPECVHNTFEKRNKLNEALQRSKQKTQVKIQFYRDPIPLMKFSCIVLLSLTEKLHENTALTSQHKIGVWFQSSKPTSFPADVWI